MKAMLFLWMTLHRLVKDYKCQHISKMLSMKPYLSAVEQQNGGS